MKGEIKHCTVQHLLMFQCFTVLYVLFPLSLQFSEVFCRGGPMSETAISPKCSISVDDTNQKMHPYLIGIGPITSCDSQSQIKCKKLIYPGH